MPEFFLLKDVALPEKTQGSKTKYPFEHMEVGQTFFLEGRKASKFSPYVGKFGRRLERKFGCADMAMKPLKDADGKQIGWEPCKPTEKGAVMGCVVQRLNDDGTPAVKAAAPQGKAKAA